MLVAEQKDGSTYGPDDITLEIGGSRYIQRPGAVRCLGAEVARLGSKCLIVTGRESLESVWKEAFASLSEEGVVWSVAMRTGMPTRAEALRFARRALGKGCDVVVGIGGGGAMDLAKAVADSARFPLVEVPTSTATYAASTPRANMFDFKGIPDGHVNCVDCAKAIIADEALLSRQPARFVAAGSLAAMAQVNRAALKSSSDRSKVASKRPAGRSASRGSAPLDSGFLETIAVPAYRDVQAGSDSAMASKAIFTILAVPGLAETDVPDAGCDGFPQRFHDEFAARFPEYAARWLYGEIVGVGVLMVESYLGDAREVDRLKAAMREMRMPTSLRRLGVSPDDPRIEAFREALCNCNPVALDAKGKRRFRRAFDSAT